MVAVSVDSSTIRMDSATGPADSSTGPVDSVVCDGAPLFDHSELLGGVCAHEARASAWGECASMGFV
jgi:hypothetical protein